MMQESLRLVMKHASMLPKTIGLDTVMVINLDALRKQRNSADYTGDLVTDKELSACIKSAVELYVIVTNWIKKNHPEILN